MRCADQGYAPVMSLENHPDARVFPFRFTTAYALAARPFGVTPDRARVVLTPTTLVAHYGHWALETDVPNIVAAEIDGPYRFLKTAGPAHLSLADGGLTFASNGDRGVCLQLRMPMRGMEPFGILRHPNLTVTVADCEGLVEALFRR